MITPKRMFKLCFILLTYFWLSYGYVYTQSCREQGQTCSSNYACCGGCCRDGQCIDETMQVCILENDLCLEYYCPPGMECFMYHPKCVGCRPQPNCRTADPF